MINKSLIINPLEKYLNCSVISANQHSPAPKYPYVSFTITAPIHINQGSYGTESDGIFYKPVRQTWSFTVQSDDEDECDKITLKLYHWFSLVGITYLSDNNISVERLEDISNRDNLITIQYEYRRGFDVRLVAMDEIEYIDETIETIKLGDKSIKENDLIKTIDELLEVTHDE